MGNPNLPRRLGRAVYRTLGLLALVSAIAGGPFAYLAWVEARSSVADQAAMVQEIKELRKIAALSLEQVEQHLVLQRATLALQERQLPEAERTRLGIEQLAKLLDRQIEVVREERRKLKDGVPRSPAPAVPSWWSPDSEASRTANKIFDTINRP